MLIKEKIIEPVYLPEFYMQSGWVATNEKKYYLRYRYYEAWIVYSHQRDQDLK